MTDRLVDKAKSDVTGAAAWLTWLLLALSVATVVYGHVRRELALTARRPGRPMPFPRIPEGDIIL